MRKLPPPKEKDIESEILLYLESLRIPHFWFWKQPMTGYFDPRRSVYRKQASRFARNGVPDICCIHRGRFLGLEVKSKIGRVSEDQKAWHAGAQEAEGLVAVVRSVEDVRKALVEWNVVAPLRGTDFPTVI